MEDDVPAERTVVPAGMRNDLIPLLVAIMVVLAILMSASLSVDYCLGSL